MSMNNWMDKENEIFIYNRRKEWNPFICSKMGGREGHHVMQNKLFSQVNSVHAYVEIQSSDLKAKEWTLELI